MGISEGAAGAGGGVAGFEGGGVAGFAMGGPLGAILGAVAGHAVDKMRAEEAAQAGGDFFEGRDDRAERQVAFTTAIIVLAAKMAKADGHVTRDEVDAFKRIFQVPAHEMKAVGRVFDEAKKDSKGFEPYAAQIADMFRHQPQVMEELLGALFHIAMADGVFHPGEAAYLKKVAMIFGFTEADYERLKAIFTQGFGRGGDEGDADPYEVLGVSRDASDDEIKKTYRQLVRENHPDKLMAEGLPEEFVEQANEKLATINAAYDRIQAERGFK